ncbi:MAG: class I SAM-dependent methyltransferase [Candidatus Omnitrophota bacterium]
MSVTKMNGSICSHTNSKEIGWFGTVRLYECGECGVVFSERCREDLDSASVYEKYYKNESAGRFGFGLEYVVRLFRFFRAFKIFTVSPGAKKILDIGSGRGFTLYYLKKIYGFTRTAGTQISRNAFEFSKNKLGLEIYDKDLLELPLDNGAFDVITIWHVLEHVNKPEQYIEKISSLLGGRGKLIIEVPNYDSWSRHLTAKYWLSYDLKHHIFFFTPGSLSAMLEKHGFSIKHTQTFSLEYSAFTSAQSLVNFITGSDNLFFRALQTGKLNLLTVMHAALLLLLMPVCLLINLFMYFSKHGEVLFIVAEKNLKAGSAGQ